MGQTLLNLGFISPLFAAEGHSVSTAPVKLFQNFGWLTNSLIVAAIVAVILIVLTRLATRQVRLIPSGVQNFWEFLVEFLYDQVEQIVGPKIAPKVFPLLATIFVYILLSNYFGLLPGIGTIGWGHTSVPLTLDGEPEIPLLRPGTADLNTTLGMALVFMVVWFIITMKETGPVEFIKHLFAPKGGITGILKIPIIIIFLIVGVIEIVSIAFRPVSLSMRLFGNIFAGENLLHTMAGLGESFGFGPILSFITKVGFPLPFYVLEILVGLLQAVVFSLLCAVYIQLSTAHEEDDDH